MRLESLMLLLVPSAAAETLTIRQAVDAAVRSYPSLRVSREKVNAAAASINLARTAFLPRADFYAQLNRATHNNVFGLLLPQATLPGISGPGFGAPTSSNAFGSAVGLLFSWEPFDFGLREANVRVAEAGRRLAEAGVAVTRLQAAAAAADAFLTLLAAEQTVKATQASVIRAGVLHQVVAALAGAELRPGADESRARAELAIARNQLIQAEQAVTVARASLAQFVETSDGAISVLPGAMLSNPFTGATASEVGNHPLAQERRLAIEEFQARRRALERAGFPRFLSQSAVYARGTGANPDGTTLGTWSGIGPNAHNWAFGFSVAFPLFDLPSLREQQRIERHREAAERARQQQVLRELKAASDRAQAFLDAARRTLENTPIQLQAATEAQQQAQARYQAGLATIAEVAEAERVLTQAQIDDSLARLNTWRGLLAVAAANGDLEPFLAAVEK